MHYEKPGMVLVAGVLALGGSYTLSLAANAQGGILDRIQERREAREQSRDQSQNQQQGQQQGQQQYPPQGQPQYAPQSQMPQQQPEISMVTLQTQMGPNGQQMVITPKGYTVPLPGTGVNGPAVQIYMGSTGGYWYVDKNNQQVDLTPAVQQMQARMAQAQTQPPVQPPQYAPVPQEYSNQGSSSNSGSGAMTAAVAGGLGAMTGAMAGAAISNSANSWNTIPYGTAVRYGAAATPYYNQGGKPVYINNSSTVNAYHANNIQQQQNWYKAQQTAQGANWKAWQQPTTNPFVSSGAGMAAYGAEQGQQAKEDGVAAGAAADRYGHNQGEQAARYGAAAGATADHYGHEQGQNAAKYGAAAGAHADNVGHEDGQQAARFGAARGADGARADGMRGAADGGRKFGGERSRRFR